MMARHLQVFPLLSRLCSPSSATPLASFQSCRFANSKPWSGQRYADGDEGSHRPKHSDDFSDGDQDLEDVDDKLQTLLDEGRKRQKALKFHIMRRQMTPKGPPERKLTWDAIEQIRYLKREQPQEWTVERLAESFSVNPDAILRILRTKFIPPTDRKIKQDTKVMATYNQQVLPSGAGTQQAKLKLPGGHTPALLSANKEGALISLTGQAQLIQGKGSGSSDKSLISVTARNKQLTTELSEHGTLSRPAADEVFTDTELTEEDLEQEEAWDGQVLTERELEEFMEMDKPPPPVQIGSEFFDQEGNFLYRV